jgi:serine/threonine protein kinase
MNEENTILPKKDITKKDIDKKLSGPADKILSPGDVVAGRYTIQKLLGAGGMGAVFLAKDQMLSDESIAMKILHPELVDDERQTQRFLREVQLMRRVQHPNVIRTYDAGIQDNLVYFTMEFVSGKTLDKVKNISLTTLPNLIINICEGLEAIHKAGVIHRDLKPANIMVTDDGIAKIADFGVARPEVSNITAHNEIIGSAFYIAPEVWIGNQFTNSIDLYSLGILLYEITTQTLPFEGDSPAALMRQHLEFTPKAPRDLNRNIPPWLSKLILKLLGKTATERPKHAREVIEYVKLNTELSPIDEKTPERKTDKLAEKIDPNKTLESLSVKFQNRASEPPSNTSLRQTSIIEFSNINPSLFLLCLSRILLLALSCIPHFITDLLPHGAHELLRGLPGVMLILGAASGKIQKWIFCFFLGALFIPIEPLLTNSAFPISRILAIFLFSTLSIRAVLGYAEKFQWLRPTLFGAIFTGLIIYAENSPYSLEIFWGAGLFYFLLLSLISIRNELVGRN